MSPFHVKIKNVKKQKIKAKRVIYNENYKTLLKLDYLLKIHLKLSKQYSCPLKELQKINLLSQLLLKNSSDLKEEHNQQKQLPSLIKK